VVLQAARNKDAREQKQGLIGQKREEAQRLEASTRLLKRSWMSCSRAGESAAEREACSRRRRRLRRSWPVLKSGGAARRLRISALTGCMRTWSGALAIEQQRVAAEAERAAHRRE
jgi:hypothetical protein